MATGIRSSPRLRALLYSNPSGKPAVFAPRLNRVDTTSDRALRSKTSTLNNYESSSPSKLSRGKKLSEKQPVVSKCRSKGTRNKGGASDNALVGRRRRLDSSEKTQRSSTSQGAGKAQIGSSKRSKSGRMLGRDEARSVEVATRCKQRKNSRDLVSSVNNPIRNGSGGSMSISVKRKRGRPPKNAGSCKRVKITPTITRKPEVDAENTKLIVIDLTCDNEAIGDDEIDSEALVTAPTPSLFTGLHLSQTSSTDSVVMCSPEVSENQHDLGEEGTDGGDRGTDTAVLTDTETESDYLMTSLDPDETIAQLFDLGVKESRSASMNKTSSSELESETVTVPSLKRSKNMNLLATAVMDVANSEQTAEINSSSSDDALDTLCSPTEESEYPPPSTPQQKLLRRLARQKQLEEMRTREAAVSREERLLRRKGALPDTKATQGQGSTKRISWRDETDLVEMIIYSPVRDDDADTISIHSDDALNMELTLSAT